MKRGHECWYTFQPPNKRRPVLNLTRDSASRVFNSVTVAPVSSFIGRIPTELILTTDDGLLQICAVNFDNLQAVPKAVSRRSPAAQIESAGGAVALALGLAELQ